MKEYVFKITVRNPKRMPTIKQMGKVHDKLIKYMKGNGGEFIWDESKTSSYKEQTK